MSLFQDLFGPVMALFVASEGAKATIEPLDNKTSNGDLYGSGGQSMWGESPKWESRVESAPSSGPEL